MKPGSRVEHVFAFRNAGGVAVELTDVLPDCGCHEYELPRRRLEPNERGELTVAVDVRGRTEVFQARFRIAGSVRGGAPILLGTFTLQAHLDRVPRLYVERLGRDSAAPSSDEALRFDLVMDDGDPSWVEQMRIVSDLGSPVAFAPSGPPVLTSRADGLGRVRQPVVVPSLRDPSHEAARFLIITVGPRGDQRRLRTRIALEDPIAEEPCWFAGVLERGHIERVDLDIPFSEVSWREARMPPWCSMVASDRDGMSRLTVRVDEAAPRGAGRIDVPRRLPDGAMARCFIGFGVR